MSEMGDELKLDSDDDESSETEPEAELENWPSLAGSLKDLKRGIFQNIATGSAQREGRVG